MISNDQLPIYLCLGSCYTKWSTSLDSVRQHISSFINDSEENLLDLSSTLSALVIRSLLCPHQNRPSMHAVFHESAVICMFSILKRANCGTMIPPIKELGLTDCTSLPFHVASANLLVLQDISVLSGIGLIFLSRGLQPYFSV